MICKMMKMKVKRIIYLFLFLCVFVGGRNDVWGKEQKGSTAYQQLFNGKRVVTREGLMTLHQVDGKVLVEFPLNLLNKEMMFTSVIRSISDNGEGVVGQFSGNGTVFTFMRIDSVIQARVKVPSLGSMKNISGERAVDQALEQSNKPGVYKTFRILASTSDERAVVVDMTSFFLEHTSYTSPFPNYAGNSMFGLVFRNHKVQADRTMLCGIKAFPNNIVVTAEQGYDVDQLFMGSMLVKKDEKVSVVSDKILMLLPEEVMDVRKADSRVGVGFVKQTTFAGGRDKLQTSYWATRWRIEPADVEGYRNGKLVEPKKPIVFYLDSVMPSAWVKYIREGVEEWNKAFREIGFKDVVRVVPFPKGDTLFDATNINYSVIRYAPQWLSTLQCAVYTDPRSGEILNASIYIHDNMVASITQDRMFNTMTADPSVRCRELTEQQLGEGIKMMVAREAGLCLGFVYNLSASSVIPVDSLRSASFTRQYGLSSSVMDFLTCNYVAQPEDVRAGVRLIQENLGVYDYCLVKWSYQPIYEENEDTVLKAWVKSFREKPYCRFRRNPSVFEYDPDLDYYDLGDDPIKALNYRIKNMKVAIRNLYEWYREEDKDYSWRKALVARIQYAFTNQGVKNVARYIGGIRVDEVHADEGKPNYVPVPKVKQKEVLRYLVGLMKDLSWLDNREMMSETEINSPVENSACNTIINVLFARMPQLALCASNSDDPYTPEEYVNDLYRMVWEKTLKNTMLTDRDMNLQLLFLGKVMASSTVAAGSGILEPVRQQGFYLAEPGAERYSIYEIQKVVEVCQFMGWIGIEPELVQGFGSQPNILATTYSTSHLYLQMLLEIEQLVKSRVEHATGKTKLHYEYILHKINRAKMKE